MTSKRREDMRHALEPIGNYLNSEIQSYVEMEIHKIPENLLHTVPGKSPFMQPCDPMGFANAVKIATHKAIGGRQDRPITVIG